MRPGDEGRYDAHLESGRREVGDPADRKPEEYENQSRSSYTQTRSPRTHSLCITANSSPLGSVN
jgi:hypothetical protein